MAAIGANWKDIWKPVWKAVWTQVAAAPAPSPATVTGGGSSYFRFEQERERRRRRKRELDAAREAIEAIDDPVVAEIAEILQEQERKDERRNDLERLRKLANEYRGSEVLSPRVNAAIERVQERQTISALLSLERELRRMADEEDVAIMMLLLND